MSEPAPRTDKATATYEKIVEGLAFTPFLHLQFHLLPPMRLEISTRKRAPLYVVGAEGWWIQWEDQAPIALEAGDVVFLPHAGRHWVFTDPHAPLKPWESLLSHKPVRHGSTYNLTIGGDAAPLAWTGSFYWTADLASHPLVAGLPPVMRMNRSSNPTWLPLMAQVVQWISDIRAGGKGVGMTQAMTALMQHLVLEWLRAPERATPAASMAPAAVQDPRITPALEAIHARPAEAWTATSLAALCHLSRTTFTQRFQAQMQLPPMRYLARWRVHLADRMLKDKRLTLQQAADAVGYSTGAILARAYKRERGVSPTLTDTAEQSAAKTR